MGCSGNVIYLLKQRFGHLLVHYRFFYLFISRDLVDFPQVFGHIRAESVFPMLTNYDSEKVSSGVRLGFVPYFYQNHS